MGIPRSLAKPGYAECFIGRGGPEMTTKFVCQNCEKETEAELDHDEELNRQAFYCQHCGAKHVSVMESRAPGGPVEMQFRVVED